MTKKKDYLFEGPFERIMVLPAIHLILILFEQLSRFTDVFTPKVGLSSSKKKYCISFNESPLKMMKNVFYRKALFY